MTSTSDFLTTELRDLLYNQCIDNTCCFSFFIYPTCRIRVCKIRFVSTDENRGKPCPVCKNNCAKSLFVWVQASIKSWLSYGPFFQVWHYQSYILHFEEVKHTILCVKAECCIWIIIWAEPSEFVSSSIPSWQTLTAHAQPFRGARDLAFCLKVPLDSLLVWASSEGSGETARMRRLAWTFAARIGDK